MADITPILKLAQDMYPCDVHITTEPPNEIDKWYLVTVIPENPVNHIHVPRAHTPWRVTAFFASRLPDTCLSAFYEHSDGSKVIVNLYYEKPSDPSPRTDWARLAE